MGANSTKVIGDIIKDPGVLPYVRQSVWSDSANYSFLDARYDARYATKADLGAAKSDLVGLQASLSATKADLAGLQSSLAGMQATYNSNFAAIASSVPGASAT